MSLILTVLLAVPAADAKPLTAEQLREEEAYTIGLQAYVYGFPVVEMYRVRYRALWDPANKQPGKLNQFSHTRELRDHTAKTVVSPNNDTLYSSAWLDLSGGPVVLYVPDAGKRYMSFQLMDFYTNNVAIIGPRTTGGKGGDFAIVGPGWKGKFGESVKRINSPTNAAWLLGRTLVEGNDDLPAVHELQDRVALKELKPSKRPGNPFPAYDITDPLRFFELLNVALKENPPPEREAALMSLFGHIGVGPQGKFKVADLDPATAKGLRRAVEVGKQLTALPAGGPPKVVNGWVIPPKQIGNFGEDYRLRAEIGLKALAALSPEEAVYLRGIRDDKERPLSGKHRYVLRFEKGDLPPHDAFWSVTMYRLPERLFVPNDAKKYALGDRAKGLVYGKDGSLELILQRESPGKEKEANWLPTPEGDFELMLRHFLPRKPVLDGTWKPPVIKWVD